MQHIYFDDLHRNNLSNHSLIGFTYTFYFAVRMGISNFHVFAITKLLTFKLFQTINRNIMQTLFQKLFFVKIDYVKVLNLYDVFLSLQSIIGISFKVKKYTFSKKLYHSDNICG